MRRSTLILVTLLLVSSSARAADPTRHSAAVPPNAAGARPAVPEALDPNVFRCGPIQAKDPAVRARIEQLYREQFDLRQSTQAQVRELALQAQSVTDSAARLELNREGGRVKEAMQLRHMELGLQIARLNGDAARVAEFEHALDALRHPERSLPIAGPDADAVARRQRQLDSAK